jgi:hypothetical protein
VFAATEASSQNLHKRGDSVGYSPTIKGFESYY